MSITNAFAKTIANYDSQDSLGSRLRTKRIAPLLEMIESTAKTYSSVSIIDIGGTAAYWRIVPRQYLLDHNVRITIVNLPGTVMPQDDGLFTFVAADGCNLAMFSDKSFQIAHSNSVLEHVGDWPHMIAFSSEISRVARQYFVQTPNFWFPMEPHCMMPFFHWLPKFFRVWLVRHFQLGNWLRAVSADDAVEIVDSARLLNKKQFLELFGDAEIVTEMLFRLPKSFVAIRR